MNTNKDVLLKDITDELCVFGLFGPKSRDLIKTLSNDNFENYDLFLYKIKGDGTKEWYKQIGSSESDVGRGITIDSKNSLFLTGYTYGNFYTNNNNGSSDIFLMKFNSDGALQ